MKKLLLTFLICFSSYTAFCGATYHWYGKYVFRKEFFVQVATTSSAANFPQLVEIYSNDIVLNSSSNACNNEMQQATAGTSTANPIWTDLDFSQGDHNTQTPWQMDGWDTSNGILQAWVVFNSIGTTGNQYNDMMYGTNQVPTTPKNTTTTGPFTAANGFLAVYHFNEPAWPSSGQQTVLSGASTASSNLTTVNMTTTNFVTSGVVNLSASSTATLPNYTTGIIGKYYTFNTVAPTSAAPNPAVSGTVNQYMTSTVVPTLSTAFTVSAWIKPAAVSGTQTIFTNLSATIDATHGGFKLGMSGAKLTYQMNTVTPTVVSYTGNTTLTAGTWYYVSMVFDGTNLYGYVNGAIDGTAVANTANIAPGTTLTVGSDLPAVAGTPINPYKGGIDELRLLSVSRAQTYLAREYLNQSKTYPLTLDANGSNTNSTATTNAGNYFGGSVGVPFTSNNGTEVNEVFYANGYAPGGVTFLWSGQSATAPTDPKDTTNWLCTTSVVNTFKRPNVLATLTPTQPLTNNVSSYFPYANLQINSGYYFTNPVPQPSLTGDLTALNITPSNCTIDLNGYSFIVGCNISGNSFFNTGTIFKWDNNYSSTLKFNSADNNLAGPTQLKVGGHYITDQSYFDGSGNSTSSTSCNSNEFGNLIVNTNGTLYLQQSGYSNKITPVAATGGSSGYFNIYNQLSIVKGNVTTTAYFNSVPIGNGALITLKSTATQTASVLPITGTSTAVINANAERFVNGGSDGTTATYSASYPHRGYRLMSSPIYTGTASGTNVFDMNYLQNSSLVAGIGGSTNGFNFTGNPTLYLYREDVHPVNTNTTFTGGALKPVAHMNLTGTTGGITYNNIYDLGVPKRATITGVADSLIDLPVGNGFMYYFIGNSTNTASATGSKTTYPFDAPEDITFSQKGNSGYNSIFLLNYYTGLLNTGTINVKLWYTNPVTPAGTLSYTANNLPSQGFNLVGNPYASTINWEKFNRNTTAANSTIYGSNLSNTIYFFNPTTKQYDNYTRSSATPAITDTTTTVNPAGSIVNGTSATNMIASGQGFFVVATGAGATLSFRENAKTTTQPTTLANSLSIPKTKGVDAISTLPKIQSATPGVAPIMQFQLYRDSVNIDEVAIEFLDGASTKFVPGEDAIDLGGIGASVSLSTLSSDSVALAVNVEPSSGSRNLEIPFYVNATPTSAGLTTVDVSLNVVRWVNDPLYKVYVKDHYTGKTNDLRAVPTYRFTIDTKVPASYGKKRLSLVLQLDTTMLPKVLAFNGNIVSNGSQLNWTTKNESTITTFTLLRSTDNGATYQQLSQTMSDGTGSHSYLDLNPFLGKNYYKLHVDDGLGDTSTMPVVLLDYNPLVNNWITSNKLVIYPNPVGSTPLHLYLLTFPNGNYTLTITTLTGNVVYRAQSSDPNWMLDPSKLMPGTYFSNVYSSTGQLVAQSKFIKQ